MAKITRIKAQDQRQKHQLDEIAEAEVVTKVKAGEVQAEGQATDQGKNKAQVKAGTKAASKKSAPAGAVKNTKTEVENRGEADKASKSAKNAPAGKSSKASKTGKNAKATKAAKATKKSRPAKKPRRTPAILKPFAALGGYVKASWAELRQVRWPSRKATWKLTLAVIVYCVIFILLIMGLDLLFGELFGWLLG